MSRRRVASSSAQPSMADNAFTWLGGVFDQMSSRFDSPLDNSPRYSKSKCAAVGSPLPPGDYISSTSPLPSSPRQASTSSTFTEENTGFVPTVGKQHAFPAKRVVQPGLSSRDSLKTEEPTPATLGDEVPAAAPSEQCAGRDGSRKRTARHEVPPPPPPPQQQHHHHHHHHQHQHESSTFEKDLQEDADCRVARAKAAAKRLAKKQSMILQLTDTVNQIKRRKDVAVSQAGLLEGAASISSAKLELAQAEASAVKATLKGYSRPGRIVRSLMAKWEDSPQLDEDEAVRRVVEATRAHASARAKTNRVWDDVDRSMAELTATSTTLREAQEAHARASRVFIVLEEKANYTAKRAAAMTKTIEKSRLYWEGMYKACEMGGSTNPSSSKVVVPIEDGFTIYQEERRIKRIRH